MAFSWLIHGGDPNYFRTGMILQVQHRPHSSEESLDLPSVGKCWSKTTPHPALSTHFLLGSCYVKISQEGCLLQFLHSCFSFSNSLNFHHLDTARKHVVEHDQRGS